MSARDLARQMTLIRSTLLCVFVSDYVCAGSSKADDSDSINIALCVCIRL